LNQQGQLVTGAGYQVLGSDNQPITLVDPLTQGPLTTAKVLNDGTIVDQHNNPLTDNAGNPLSLLLSRIDKPNKLVPQGNGLFKLDPKSNVNVQAMQPNGQVLIKQGFIEHSNVDPTRAMINMMGALRSYESNQKVIQYYDKSLNLAVNQVGKVT
jgi:flagellar basal-body rod protein FlgF